MGDSSKSGTRVFKKSSFRVEIIDYQVLTLLVDSFQPIA